MSLKPAIILTVCLGMSACATVDLTEMASQNSAIKTNAIERNIVQRSASALRSVFASKGWTTKSSKDRIQSTASILLKGLENKNPVTPKSHGYAVRVTDASMVQADIREASQHVEQTTKAAEVYLAMAPGDASLLKELASLEKALLTCRQAEVVFDRAQKNTKLHSPESLSGFTSSVDALRDVTNAYGDRVRESSTKIMTAS